MEVSPASHILPRTSHDSGRLFDSQKERAVETIRAPAPVSIQQTGFKMATFRCADFIVQPAKLSSGSSILFHRLAPLCNSMSGDDNE